MMQSMKIGNEHSRMWLGYLADIGIEYRGDTFSVIEMAGFRRALEQFITIACGKNIPVRYKLKESSVELDISYINISANIPPNKIDAKVGVSLHEATHVSDSDLKLFKEISNCHILATNSKYEFLNDLCYRYSKIFNDDLKKTSTALFDITNWVDDRRIDYIQQKRSPGYVPYYDALYETYFENPIIEVALRSPLFRNGFYDDYKFRIYNLINENSELDALPGLQEIYDIVGLGNMGRFQEGPKGTWQVFYQCVKPIFEILLNNVVQPPEDPGSDDSDSDSNSDDTEDSENKKQKSDDDSDGKNDDSNDTGKSEKDDSDNDGSGGKSDKSDDDGDNNDSNDSGDGDDDSDEDEKSGNGNDDSDDSDDSDGKGKDTSELSDEDLEKLIEAIANQEKFVRGEFDKEGVSADVAHDISKMESSNTTIEEAGTKNIRTKVIVMRHITKENLDTTPIFSRTSHDISDGIQKGKILAKKLEIRNEDNEEFFTRKRLGHIDKRMLAYVGCGTEAVFKQSYREEYDRVMIHVSIDMSSSVSGYKWISIRDNAIALAYAASQIDDFEIVISARSTIGTTYYSAPWVGILFDSRRDKFSAARYIFENITPAATTPEGLCFEVLSEEIIRDAADYDDYYFINFSDGMPYCSVQNLNTKRKTSYTGEMAVEHTREEVVKLLKKDIKVLSFFIESGYGEIEDDFRRMYPNCASFIDPANIYQVINEINRRLLEKTFK